MYEELIESLREDAEWAEGNIWEVPIMLPDHLKQAAEAIEKVKQAAAGRVHGMVVYVSGKMTGLPDLGRAKFHAAAKQLRDEGFIVLNPAELPDKMPVKRYMPLCLAMLDAADAVYALNNWEDSKGAKIEIQYAQYQGKEVYYEGSEDKL